ncbi:MAG: Tetratricopeptide 2 repeat protein, partial [Pedosphaera sp.]|nr:Tetratricopeptide 2 repeat protein [Pedosphaera sp.]
MKDKFRLLRQNWVIGALLALITCFAYWPVVHFPFVNYDDYDYVFQNAHVNHGLSWNNARWALTSTDACNWHPLTWISHMVDCQFYALKAGGHHVTSLLLHVANSLLLLGVLFRMTGKRWASAFVAALFAWHPLHVESVAWVAERKDVLSTCFWLLTMAAYLHYVAKRSVSRYLLVVVLFALGLMSKPMVVTLPFTLLLLDYWPLRRIADCGLRLPETASSTPIATKPLPLGQLVLEKVPLLLLSAASSVITYLVQQQAGAIIVSSDLPLGLRVANALVSYCLYLGKAFWPTPLAAPYPHPGEWPMGTVVGAVLFLLIFTAAALAQRRSRPYLIVGWLWFLGVLVPAIGFVQVGGQGMADRYAYIPLIGVLIMVAWGVPDLLGQWPRREWAFGLGSAAALAGCLLLTRTQVQYWSDSEVLFRHALAVTKDNPLAHTCLGTALSEKNKTDEAIAEYEKALKLEPALGDAQHHLGVALTKQGRTKEAIGHLELALKAWPTLAAGHYDLGIALGLEGRTEEAIAAYEKTLQLRPEYPHAHYNLAG